jgi:hypothetical protein
MKRDGILGRALLAFGIAVLFYVAVYHAIEHRRRSKGPWQVTFVQEQGGAQAIFINQHTIGITNVRIMFPVDSVMLTNRPMTLNFREARKTPFDLPFGKCVFLDTVFLPGTVALEISGHQIQLMPRVLTVDGVEREWISGESVSLTNKPARKRS